MLAVTLSALLASCALVACGDRSPIDERVGAEGGADASVFADGDADVGPVSDVGASVDAVTTCNPQLPPRVPGCYLPSGRPCINGCTCDDGCNQCMCVDGGYLSTDIACPVSGTGPACKGPLSSLCNRYRFLGVCPNPAAPAAYYCPGALLSACGDSVCPSLDCTFDRTDPENGGSYWCCPQ